MFSSWKVCPPLMVPLRVDRTLYLRSKTPPYPPPLRPPRTDFVSLGKTKHSRAEVLLSGTLRVGVCPPGSHQVVRSTKQVLSAPARSKMASKMCISGAQKVHLTQTEMAQTYLLGTSDELGCSVALSFDACQPKRVSDVLE